MEPRISLITLGVSDLARARDFYVQLGWEPTDGEDIVFFQAGPMVVALWDRAHLAEDTGVEDAGRSGGFTLAYVVRAPAEVDVVIDEARRAGGRITGEPAETFWGGYSGKFTDPDGHPWEIAHNPHWIVRPDGSVSISGSAA